MAQFRDFMNGIDLSHEGKLDAYRMKSAPRLVSVQVAGGDVSLRMTPDEALALAGRLFAAACED